MGATPMTGYRFALTCTHCGAPIAHRADGAVQTCQTTALADCTNCGAELKVEVVVKTLRPSRLDLQGAPMSQYEGAERYRQPHPVVDTIVAHWNGAA